jgi:hypothetical protein
MSPSAIRPAKRLAKDARPPVARAHQCGELLTVSGPVLLKRALERLDIIAEPPGLPPSALPTGSER